MRVERKVALSCGEVTVRELTVGEIRAWLREVEQSQEGDFDVVGLALFEEITFEDFERLSDITRKQLDELAPSEIRELKEACEEVNADFFAMRRRISRLGQAALGNPDRSSSSRTSAG